MTSSLRSCDKDSKGEAESHAKVCYLGDGDALCFSSYLSLEVLGKPLSETVVTEDLYTRLCRGNK